MESRAARGGLVIALFIVLAAIVAAPIARSIGDVPAVEDATRASGRALETSGLGLAGLRSFPILSEERRALRGDDAAIEAETRALLEEVGLGPWWDERTLWADLIVREIRPDELDYDHGPDYPYEYPTLEAELRSRLTQSASPEAVLDLASLLLVSAEFGTDSNAETAEYRIPPESISYVLLRWLNETNPTCESQLELAHLVSLGQNAPLDAVRSEVTRAQKLCGDDPTPLWLLGRVAAQQVTIGGSFLVSKYTPEERIAIGEDAFAQLRASHPKSPLGWTGAADLWLGAADRAEALSAMPFQVRSWRTNALAYYEIARTKATSARLLAGQAQALSALGEHDRAIDLAEDLLDADPTWAPYRVLLLKVLFAAQRFDDIVDLRWDPDKDRSPRAEGYFVGSVDGFGPLGEAPGVAIDGSYDPAGGADTNDLSFIPVTGRTMPWCPNDILAAAYVATGAKAPDVTDVTPGFDCLFRASDEPDVTGLWDLFDAERDGDDDIFDLRQDFWRSIGEFDRAAEVVDARLEADAEDGLAWARSAELEFLDGDYATAAERFERARPLAEAAGDDSGVPYGEVGNFANGFLDQIELGLAESLWRSGEHDAAVSSWERVTEGADDDATSRAWMRSRAERQWGSALLREGDTDAAVDHLEKAVQLGAVGTESLSGPISPFRLVGGPLKGSEFNNLALAAAKEEEFDVATSAAREALVRDPANPIFLDTLAFVHQLAGDVDEAIAAYRDVLGADTTSYVSANNLAVLLAGLGREAEAEKLLEGAVAVAPDYATAWHNLGVVRGWSASPQAFFTAQGALARAVGLDRSFRGEDGELIVDDEIYDSGVDVSRPVAADWTYAKSASSNSHGFALTMLLLVLVRIAWALGLDQASGWISERVIASSRRTSRRVAWIWRRVRVRWALLVSVEVLTVPVVWGAPLGQAVTLGLIAVALVLLPLAVRAFVTRGGLPAHFGWTPALLVGIVGTPFGLSVVPYPALDEGVSRRVRWAPVVVLGAVTAVLTLASLLTSVPYLRTAAMMALALVGSLLLPVPPFDGSQIADRRRQFGVAAGLALISVAFVMKWV